MMTIAPLTRRRLLATAAATSTLTLAGGIARPYLSRAADRPGITHGLQSGDTSVSSGVVWARTDRPARLTFDLATTDSFKTIARSVTLDALPESDFAVKALIDGLPSGQDIFYRVRSVDLSDTSVVGEPATGRFRTAPTDRRNISFVWSGDTAGQGWGIDESRGGMKIYETMRKLRPDFFIHSGDTIYADGAIQAEQKLPDGTLWKNLVLEERPRSPKRSPSTGRATNTICSTRTCARSTPKSDAGAMGRS